MSDIEKILKETINENGIDAGVIGRMTVVDMRKKAEQKLKTYISNLLDSTALEETEITKDEFGVFIGPEHNRAVAEQHKRIKLVKEKL